MTRVHQVNLQPHFGGGEVYSASLCRALHELGVGTDLYCHPAAQFWDDLDLPASTRRIPVPDAAAIVPMLGSEPQWLLGHGPLPPPLLAPATHLRTAVAHMPLFGRTPEPFLRHERIFAVSAYVRDGFQQAGLPAWPEPLFGVAGLSRRAGDGDIRQTSLYDWDRRKFRDRLLGMLEPLTEPWRRRPVYARRPGMTLGIVSRLTPIKQLPLMFTHLATALARVPGVNLEIFGSGGYASVRDVKQALQPLGERARFWGMQRDVARVYAGIDYLLTGLPEKEALGLNVIEAQACGTPVLAVNAPPFTETVAAGVSGYLFTDPREDEGAALASLLEELRGRPRIDPRLAVAHLEQFSFAAFVERLRPVVAWAQQALRP